ncbi:hypothetical protein CONPUDRAFT_161873 [Coniophora puteana RWD-64-598 SS2]|uniref:F-box domain-containing protein n=1 Tax=Coniophora puteana (strain RWD-64-598) TaxID=741705 RepID=A0A5M3N796_CONPW|nr:uncharacterized protein CONPUDRAFT_161873 [Coniophora puteana RWD-64-598 SS2]EIW87303.1 hypothetical protein CONPUDRAFT_161873 [Coniophora puteana RWD-64-598 SS2]
MTSPSAPAPARDDASAKENTSPKKRIKITEDNGWRHVPHFGLKPYFTPAARTEYAEEQYCVKESGCTQVKKKSRMGLKAGLKLLPSMPLDILFEIFGRLMPIDLLHLARTTKPFRRVLMHRSSVSVWVEVLANVPDLPLCPDDIPQPEYANLVFDTHCHGCFKPNIRNVYWRLRVRYCSACARKYLEPLDDRFRFKYGPKIARCLPHEEVLSLRDQSCCLIVDREAVVAALEKLGPEERSEYRRQQKERADARGAHASVLEEWATNQIKNREIELDILREQRREAIAAKLDLLGWSDEIVALPDRFEAKLWDVVVLDDHPHVKQAKPLTDRIWANIESDMIKYMEIMKQYRLGKERRALIQRRRTAALEAYCDHQRYNTVYAHLWPAAADYLLWDRIEALIEQPSDDELPADVFKEALRDIDDWMPHWCNRRIADAMASCDTYNIDYWCYVDESSEWATTVFSCKNRIHSLHDHGVSDAVPPATLMWWPEYMHHHCNRMKVLPPWEFHKHEGISLGEGYYPRTVQKPWSAEHLQPEEKARKVVLNILRTCGYSAQTTTEFMDEKDPRLVCLKCSFGGRCDGDRQVVARGWRDSVNHCMTKHWGDATVQWEKISDEDAEVLRRSEVWLKEQDDLAPVWRCALCHDKKGEPLSTSKEALFNHLSERHSISRLDAEWNINYLRNPGTPPVQPKPTKCRPKAGTTGRL